jgi:SNF2 family DNA or RNA helicase
LDCKGIAGTPGFQFKLELRHNRFGDVLMFGKRYGPVIETVDGTILLADNKVYRLLEAIERFYKINGSIEERLRGIAAIKQFAIEANAKLSSYLERENYTFIDDVEVEAILKDEDLIEIFPKLSSNEPIESTVTDDLANRDRFYSVTGGNTGRRRVFVSENARKKLRNIKSIPPIEGAAVPAFVKNPGSFIPEEIPLDLEMFSERVKNLGVRVYQSRPYVHVNPHSRNWFESGVKLVDDSGEETGNLNMEEFSKLAEEAIQKNEQFVKTNNGWIELPDRTKELLDADRKLRENPVVSQPFDITKLSYILEIYENINSVEYNEPLLELKETLEDSGIMDPPSDIFLGKLYPYQVEGFRWMKLLKYRNIGGLLADDMGLGKTVQVIAFLSTLKANNALRPSLIVAPLALMQNWVKELRQFCPTVGVDRVYVHQGAGRLRNKQYLEQFDIVLTSYDTLVRDQLLLGLIDWVCVICDEAQKFKNSSTATAHAVKAMKNKFRLALTGTPVENGLTELWSIIDYVQPGLLGSLQMFKQRFEKPIIEGATKEQLDAVEQELLSVIHPVYKRRKKEEVLKDLLPGKEKVRVFVDLGPEQRQLYARILRAVRSEEMDVLAALHGLRQVCSHPALWDAQYESLPMERIPKLAETMRLLREIQEKQEKVLIFTFYKKMQIILKKAIMMEFGINPEIINGDTQGRQEFVDMFNQSPGFNVMILSQLAAGVGLNIVGANHVIHYTRWWNPAIENQATDRVYRIGQKKNVYVYYPIVKGESGESMEQILDSLIRDKEELAERVLVPSAKLDCSDELMSRLRADISKV